MDCMNSDFQHNGQINLGHESVTKLKKALMHILPTIHALTGFDTTSKVRTTKKGF